MMNDYEYIELSCTECKSRRNLVMIAKPPDVGFNILCSSHYTKFLQTKIIRLSELLDTDKSRPLPTEETPKEGPKKKAKKI